MLTIIRNNLWSSVRSFRVPVRHSAFRDEFTNHDTTCNMFTTDEKTGLKMLEKLIVLNEEVNV